MEAELTAAVCVPWCHQAEASQPSQDAVVSIPVKAARMSEEQGQKWWCAGLSSSMWTTDRTSVPWQSVEATSVDASVSWMEPRGSSRLQGWERRTRHLWCSKAATVLTPQHPVGSQLSLGSTKQVTAIMLLPRDDSWTGQELSSTRALLFLHMQDDSGQPAPILQFRTRKIEPEDVPRYSAEAVCAPSSQHSAARSPS